MCSLQDLGELLRDAERLINRNRSSCDPLVEAMAVDEFEHEELGAVRFLEPVDLQRCTDG